MHHLHHLYNKYGYFITTVSQKDELYNYEIAYEIPLNDPTNPLNPLNPYDGIFPMPNIHVRYNFIETNNQVYQNIGINYVGVSTSLISVSTEPTVYVYNVAYSGGNFVTASYKVYTQSAANNGFNNGSVGVTDPTNNYFRGGTLI